MSAMYYYRPRFGIIRRLVWFGLGIGAAHWWMRSKERRLDSSCYRYQRPIEGPPAPAYAWPSAMTPTPEAPTAQEHMAEKPQEERRWGWHRRHSAPATNAPAPYDADTQADIERLQRAADALWDQRKAQAIEATVAARETARDFASENLKRLSDLLQRVGASLEEEKLRTEEQKKRWV